MSVENTGTETVTNEVKNEESITETRSETSEETQEYVVFTVKSSKGEDLEMAVVDEFNYKHKDYVVGALIVGDEINQDNLYIYKAKEIDGEIIAEKIENPREYQEIAEAYLQA